MKHKLVIGFLLGFVLGPAALYFLVLPFPIRNALFVTYAPGPSAPDIVGTQFYWHSRFAVKPDGGRLPDDMFYMVSASPLGATAAQDAIETVCVSEANIRGADIAAQIDFTVRFNKATQERFLKIMRDRKSEQLAMMMGGQLVHLLQTDGHGMAQPDAFSSDPERATREISFHFSRASLDELAMFTGPLEALNPFKPCPVPDYLGVSQDEVINPQAVGQFKAWRDAILRAREYQF